jgi:hypothetical protein
MKKTPETAGIKEKLGIKIRPAKNFLGLIAVLYGIAYARKEILHLTKDQGANPFIGVDYHALREEARGKTPDLKEIDCQLREAKDFRRTTLHGTSVDGRAIDWTNSIVQAMVKVGIPPTQENIALALVLLHRESRMDVDPAMSVQATYERKKKKYVEKAQVIPGGGQFVDWYFGLYQPQIDNAQSETEVQSALGEIYAPYELPFKVISHLSPSPTLDEKIAEFQKTLRLNTVGALQVNPQMAIQLQEKYGAEVDWNEAKKWLYTPEGNFQTGFAILFTSLEEYEELGVPRKNAVRFAFSDYNGGIYSARNAGFQVMLSDLTGEKLTPDGDLLSYDHDGVSWPVSQTERAVQTAFPDLDETSIHEQLLREKGPDFDQTKLYKRVVRTYAARHKGKSVKASMPDAGDPEGEEKYGKTFTATEYTDEAMRQYAAFRWKKCRD